MNFYTPLYLDDDYDFDGTNDLVTIHGGDPTRSPRKLISSTQYLKSIVMLDERVRLSAEMLLISSRTGQLINFTIVPDQMESYYSPQLFRRSNEEKFVLIGTGGETHGGGLYAFDVQCWNRFCSKPV